MPATTVAPNSLVNETESISDAHFSKTSSKMVILKRPEEGLAPLRSPSFRADEKEEATSSGDYGSIGDDYDDDVAGILGEEMERLNNEADAILDSIRNEVANSSEDDNASSDDYMSDDDYGGEMEDEMNDEILNLGSVTANLRQDLDEVSVESMASALSNTNNNTYRYQPKILSGEFLREKQLYGPGVGGSERNTPLLAFCVTVWSVLIILVFHVRFGAMDEFGNLSSISEFFRGMVSQSV